MGQGRRKDRPFRREKAKGTLSLSLSMVIKSIVGMDDIDNFEDRKMTSWIGTVGRWRFGGSLLEDDGEREDPLGFMGDGDGLCSLSPLQRLYVFAACLVAGLACMLLSMIVFFKPIKFALLFTFGNLLAIASTAFIIGLSKQLRMMFDPVRLYATVVYIICVVFALVCALWFQSKVLTLLAIICEICALIWYSLSYIPFARRMVSQFFISCCDTEI